MTNKLKTYTMQELYEQPLEPMAYLVDGLLTSGLYILGGSPKVGKSWMALQLCLAVCGGTAFLGRKTKRSEVLYLALEDGPQRLHSRALPPEQLRLTLVVNALKKLLAESEFRGTATELAAQLERQGNYWSPAILSKYLQSLDEALAKCGILLETKRTNSKRLLCLRYDEQAGDACDTSDGSDGCDRYRGTEGMPSLPSQPSPASRPSLAS